MAFKDAMSVVMVNFSCLECHDLEHSPYMFLLIVQAPTPAPTLAPRPAPTPVPTPAGDVHLSAYWDSGACGPLGDDYQWDWCGKTAFSCQDTVSTDRCPSGVAELDYKKGTGTCCSSVNINGCDYAYFAQYKCKEVTQGSFFPAQGLITE